MKTAKPQVLVLQHISCETIGSIADTLEKSGIGHRYVRTGRGETVPSLLEEDALIVMGGPMGVYEQDRYPFLRDEIALIRSAIKSGKPVLGICLGSQLIAAALGATVKPGPRKEIGWFTVYRSDEAKDDALFGGLPDSFEALHWHGDVFTLPEGAVPLASSKRTACQAYRHGRNVYAILFHLEATQPMIEEWTKEFAGELAEEKLKAAPITRAAATIWSIRENGRIVFERWAALLAQPHLR